MEAIQAEELTKRFSRFSGFLRRSHCWALRDVSFSVRQGEAVALLGSNGSGKTTLLRILNRLLLPTRGAVRVHGSMGIVPPLPISFAPHWDARENLDFAALLQGVPAGTARRRVPELLEQFELTDRRGIPFRVYSTGQRQRLNVARALVHDPAVLLMDEPLKSVDPEIGNWTRAWIRREFVENRGGTLLIATHQLEDVRDLCDRAIFLREGRLDGDSRAGKDPSRWEQKLWAWWRPRG